MAEIRRHWPRILEELKRRRKFAWMTVSQFAQVTDLLGSVLWLTFNEAGARDNFSRSGGEDNLRAVVADLLGSNLVIRGRIESDPPPRLDGLSVVSSAAPASGPGPAGAAGPASASGGASGAPASADTSSTGPEAGSGPADHRPGRPGPAPVPGAPAATGPAAAAGPGGGDSPRGAAARHLRGVTDHGPQSDQAPSRPPASQGDRSQADAHTGADRSGRPAGAEAASEPADAGDSEEGSRGAAGRGAGGRRPDTSDSPQPDAGNGPAADPAAGDEYEGVAPDDAVLPLSEVGQVADELVRSVLDAEFVRSEQNQSSNHSRGRF